MQVKAFPKAVLLSELADEPCWGMSEIQDGQVMQLSEEQWDAVIDRSQADL